MTQPIGAFCLVLHGHLPWVLHHGRWPHGEDWLFEAASETWLPLLGVLEQCAVEGIRPGWTLGVTPVLLEQLSHQRFREGFPRWLAERRDVAAADVVAFRAAGESHLTWLAKREAAHLDALLAQFDRYGGDLVGALVGAALGQVELLSSNATHGYHPLILHDACARAQIRCGLAASERHFGRRPRGVWLPECAYRPAGAWWPAAVHGFPRDREGVASLFGEAGVRWFFVDTHLVTQSVPVATLDGGRVVPVDASTAAKDARRAWGSPLEPVRVVERDGITPVTVLARHPELSEQVWSGEVGYPGDGRYLEFHKRHGQRGARYWRVSGSGVSLGDKEHYVPEQAADAVRSHAAHFAARVASVLRDHHGATGRFGVVCAPFDAELFGHWWHEGPAFLLEVARALHHNPSVAVLTVQEALERAPADKACALPEGTWGAGGDHRVWLNDELRFYWEVAYRAEDRFIDLWHRVDWQADAVGRPLLEAAARELLLLQASDWAFVISTRGAVDYGMRRIMEHVSAFDDLCNGLEDWLRDGVASEDSVVAHALAGVAIRDGVFPGLDLGWWR